MNRIVGATIAVFGLVAMLENALADGTTRCRR